MQKAIELQVNGKILRGTQHAPGEDSVREPKKSPALIIFHGFTGDRIGSHRMYVKISRLLESLKCHCFRFDFSGSGESDGNFEEMTLTSEIQEAKVILDFVRNLPDVDENRVSLFGHSMGGVVASVVAADCPEIVHRLILMCSAANMSAIIQGEIDKLKDTLQGRPLPAAYDNEGDLIGLPFAQEIARMDLFAMAEGFQKPVLLIHGTRDESVPVEISQKYKDRCYGDEATIRLVEGADHSFNKYEWEAEVLRSVRDFLLEDFAE